MDNYNILSELDKKVHFIKNRSQNEIKVFLREQLYSIQYKILIKIFNKVPMNYLSY